VIDSDSVAMLTQGMVALVAAVPWTLAVAWLLPRAQFAIGGLLLLAAAVALPLRELLDRSPGLELTAPLPSLLVLLAALPFVVGWIACVHGRRGGGWRRSAKLGGATLLLGLAPHGLWIGGQAWCYHHVAETATAVVAVGGCSEDAQRLLVAVRGNPQWPEQLAMFDVGTQTLTTFPGRDSVNSVGHAGSRNRSWDRRDTGARFWIQYRTVTTHQVPEVVDTRLIDLASGATHELGADPDAGLRRLPAELQAAIDEEGRQQARLAIPHCGEVFLEPPARIVWRDEDGEAHEFALPPRAWAGVAGCGVPYYWFEPGAESDHPRCLSALFDPVSGRAVADGVFASRGLVVRRHRTDDCGGVRWDRYYATTDTELPCCLPPRTWLLGFLDDDDALLWRYDDRAALPFVYRVADDRMLPITWPAGLPALGQWWLFPQRDARGRTWIRASRGRDGGATWFAIDPATRSATPMATSASDPLELIAFAGDTALLHDGEQIVRLDLATGGRTVLFPRER